uniref:Immunoglobulin subtype domain-containing protein n=1 Tax=Biomphalaria glabrata TaxID=6526 RepID=A0A2C9LI86_BIOGL
MYLFTLTAFILILKTMSLTIHLTTDFPEGNHVGKLGVLSCFWETTNTERVSAVSIEKLNADTLTSCTFSPMKKCSESNANKRYQSQLDETRLKVIVQPLELTDNVTFLCTVFSDKGLKKSKQFQLSIDIEADDNVTTTTSGLSSTVTTINTTNSDLKTAPAKVLSSDTELSAGAIAGITVGSVVAAGLVAGGVIILIRAFIIKKNVAPVGLQV